ncbi:MAG TPA: IS200/IS605 family transposase [Bacteroidales bacterium]|nr:MAG: transposase [Bacteroidetes bacterium GWF2_35_48]OFY94435.1 MAG: transposase [Bacteroidetes bacterium RIFOXYC12_FULL_35_7]HBX52049.1 IS200/IS605 family transposase [Bacteroidales bacterium]
MPNTYSQMYAQIVFATKGREISIPQKHKEELHKYITGIVSNRKQKLLAINAMPEHIHIFIGFKPNICISDLVQDIKTASSLFIKEKQWIKGRFYWQEGFGSFTYSHSQLTNVINYINNQEQHHKRKTFKEEYLEILQKYDIEFNDAYLFEWYE